MKADEILQQAAAAKSARENHDARLEGLSWMYYPNARGFQSGHAGGEQLIQEVYDT